MFKYTNLFQKKNQQQNQPQPAAPEAPSPAPSPAPAPNQQPLPPRGGGFYPGAGQQAQQQKAEQQGQPGKKPDQQTPASQEKSGFNIKIYLIYALLIGLGIAVAKAGIDYALPRLNSGKTGAQAPVKKTFSPVKATPIKLPFGGKAATPPSSPARPGTPKAEQLTKSGFTVSGIFIADDPDESTAIINSQILRVGDTIDRATVTEIDLDGVVLEKDGAQIKLQNH